MLTELGVLDGITEHVMDGVCDGVWLFGKDSFEECPLTDASKFASGAVLQQQDANGDWHPCSYLSQSFNATERNYEIYDRELLAIIRALTEW